MSMNGLYRRVTRDELLQLILKPSSIRAFLYPNDATVQKGRELDIGKSWQLIHFLLCGDLWEGPLPLANAVLGGTVLGEEDVGYGPARYLMPKEVQETVDALDEIPVSELFNRYTPADWQAAGGRPRWDDTDKDREFIRTYYVELLRFFQDAAQSQDGMLLYIA